MIPEGYTLLDSIYAGENSRVFRAQDPQGYEVVLKLGREDVSNAVRRFSREIQTMTESPGYHVMPILDYDDSLSWFAMPKAKGSLADAKVPLSVNQVIDILKVIRDALQPLHARGQVHRDLKPANILWLDDNDGARWVVSDFGIARNALGKTTAELTR